MKVALAHDYLNQYGGAERVLGVIAELFPKAPIFTLFYDPEKTYYKFAHRDIITSPLNYFEAVKNNHRLFIPLMPFAANRLHAKGYDLVISSAAGYGKGLKTGGAFHVTYCHTPLRYAWEAEDYLDTHPMFQRKLSRLLGRGIARYLRSWDAGAARRTNMFIANSNFIAEKIKKYYKRDALVVYPPVDNNIFSPAAGKRDYFLAVGRLLHYKRFDLVIEAFRRLNMPLKIVGTGPELVALRELAHGADNIEFITYVEEELVLRDYYRGAKALIFPQVEDFGLVAAEAISCGTPVLAYRGGGVREIITEGTSGLFFDAQDSSAIVDAVNRFSKIKFSSKLIQKEAEKFSKQRFQDELRTILAGQGFSI